MDYKFLDKVLDQIVSETKIDYDQGIIHFPFILLTLFVSSSSLFFSSSSSASFLFSSSSSVSSPSFPPFLLSRSFFKHCRDVYGLNDDEVDYLWEEYKQIIKDKLKNNG